MARGIVVALSGIALMTIGSIGFIVAMDGRAPVEPGAPPAVPIAPAPAAPALAPPRDARPPAAPAPGAPPAAREAQATNLELPADPAQRLRALQPLQDEVRAELEDLDVRAGCDLHGVYVTLTLETGDREVRIVDAVARSRVPEPGPEVSAEPAEEDVDEAVARCVRDRIKGMTLRAPSARAGRRWSTFFTPPPRRR